MARPELRGHKNLVKMGLKFKSTGVKNLASVVGVNKLLTDKITKDFIIIFFQI